MEESNNTIIVVGKVETDQYGNLWVTPQGGGERVKIAKKRENLHPLFQQGKAVMLEWQTYMNKPYVADAKLVEGELPAPVKPTMLPEQQAEVDRDLAEVTKPAPQAVGMFIKELGDMIRADKLTEIFGKEIAVELIKWYRSQALGITRIPYEGKDLPQYKGAKSEPKAEGDTKVEPDKNIKVSEEVSTDEEPRERPVTNPQELMAWALSHGKKYTPSWVRQQANIGDAIITDEMAVKMHQELKSLTGWED